MLLAIHTTKPLPSLVRDGQLVRIGGHVRHAPARTVAELQDRATQGRWTILVHAPVSRRGAFTLSWAVRSPTALPVSLRIVAVHAGHVLASTKPVQSAIGSAMVSCAAPAPPAIDIPVGDGWIVGGSYIQGGPFPGIDQCQSSDYTVTATNTATGAVAATQTVAAGHSYTLVVPAGNYTLKAGDCFSAATVTVTAGKQVTADADCEVP